MAIAQLAAQGQFEDLDDYLSDCDSDSNIPEETKVDRARRATTL